MAQLPHSTAHAAKGDLSQVQADPFSVLSSLPTRSSRASVAPMVQEVRHMQI